MSRDVHLNVNILNSGVFGGSWRLPGTDPFTAFGLAHYVEIAKKAEAAKLDAIFLADGPVLGDDIAYRPWNSLEPTVVLAAIAASTTRIGLIGTLSSSYNDPYDVARRLATLDLLSKGRSGFNVVTTAGAAAARNFGYAEEPEHGLRYRRAAEFVDVVRTLWNSWEPDALVGDKVNQVFADYSKIHDAQFHGEFFDVEGALNVPRSPQGEPVVVQAGASKDGRELAAKVGEVIFTAAQTIDEARDYYQDVKRRAAAAGRDPSQVVILPGLSTVIGSTETEARERRDLLDQLVPSKYAIARLAGQLGVPADALELDAALPWGLLKDPDEAGGSQTFYRIALGLARRENLTVRQLLRRLGGGAGHRIVTGTPEQIAENIISWVDAGVADGFNLMPDVLPSGFHDFADHVVPELQKRGRFRTEYSGATLRDNLGLRVPSFGRSAEQGGVVSLHFLVNIGGAGYHPAAWREDDAAPGAFVDLDHYVHAAKVAERGLLDGLLFPDIPVQQPSIARGPAATLDPTLLTSAIAVSTSNIGLIPTASTSLNRPYNLARRILSLDHISDGRAGWNAVTTFEPRAAQNFGIETLPDRDERYRRAAEFVDVTLGLWDSWEEGALVGDQEGARFADRTKVHALEHEGEFYSVDGPLTVTRSPQGRPILVQAGSSPQGVQFAARYAEVVYGTQFSLAGAEAFAGAVEVGAEQAGRRRSDVKILPGLVPVLGSTEAEAQAGFERLQSRLHPGSDAFTSFARWLGFDPDDLDIDSPPAPEHLILPETRVGPQGFFSVLAAFAAETGATVRELLAQFLGGHRVVAGTPESVADHIEEWYRGGSVDGFTVVPAVLPSSLEDFVDHVVPILQQRGLFRREYEASTLRGNLGLAEPANIFAHR